jgi:ABC-2 type transport system ATP-binding protein
MKVHRLSREVKRRLMVAKALYHKSKMLFLDELTTGMDLELRQHMWKEIIKLKNKGITIVLTTHQ